MEAGGTGGVVNMGATVTAGGKDAVESLLQGLAQNRPDLQVTVKEADRPCFRYGSGSWERALYRVDATFGSIAIQIYSLPSQRVPVLVGMRELRRLKSGLNTQYYHAMVAGHPRILQHTSKGHALLDCVRDIPLTDVVKSSDSKKQVRFQGDANTVQLGMLDIYDDDSF